MDISKSVIFAVVTGSGFLILVILRVLLKGRKKKSVSGREGMVGEIGEVAHSIHKGKEGKVFIHGELWNAVSDQELNKGEKVQVYEIDHLTLKVKHYPIEEKSERS